MREVELEWIPMPDGTRLAARLFLPEDAEVRPVPAILEYIPYRRRDSTRDGDNLTHPWFAQQGYACVRLDIRGTGDSEGVIRDEYLKQEQDDAVAAIAWIAEAALVHRQGRHDGNLLGRLQFAAGRRPTARGTEGDHHRLLHRRPLCRRHALHGRLRSSPIRWPGAPASSPAWRAPPDPLMVGEERWRDMWRERLEGWEPPFITWLQHQARDEFWKHGSICENYGDVECAVFAVGGWADGYSNAIFRMLANLKCPRLGLVGPWGHKYPHNGVPGPAIGFLQEAKRWWDYWLKGSRYRDHAGTDAARLGAGKRAARLRITTCDPAIGQARPPGPARMLRNTAAGSGGIRCPRPRRAARLQQQASKAASRSPSPHRRASASMPASGAPTAWAASRRNCRSTSGRRTADRSSSIRSRWRSALTILGAPVVKLALEADQPQALVAVRLNDLRPDGSDLRVTYGVLNLTHRDGHEQPVPLEPGKSRTGARCR